MRLRKATNSIFIKKLVLSRNRFFLPLTIGLKHRMILLQNFNISKSFASGAGDCNEANSSFFRQHFGLECY